MLRLLVCAALALAWPAAEAVDGSAGMGASTDGGASLGGTGIGSADPRKEKAADPRFKIQKKPKPDVDKTAGKPEDRKKDPK